MKQSRRADRVRRIVSSEALGGKWHLSTCWYCLCVSFAPSFEKVRCLLWPLRLILMLTPAANASSPTSLCPLPFWHPLTNLPLLFFKSAQHVSASDSSAWNSLSEIDLVSHFLLQCHRGVLPWPCYRKQYPASFFPILLLLLPIYFLFIHLFSGNSVRSVCCCIRSTKVVSVTQQVR